MIVVSDASPLIALATIGRLELLRELYGSVRVPDAVYGEAVREGRRGADAIRRADWLSRESTTDDLLVLALKNELDPGESEAIALALEADADVLLLDEKRARAVAVGLGVRVLGLLGVIALAKCRGLIPSAGEVLGALVEQAGFRVAPAITRAVLRSVGEA